MPCALKEQPLMLGAFACQIKARLVCSKRGESVVGAFSAVKKVVGRGVCTPWPRGAVQQFPPIAHFVCGTYLLYICTLPTHEHILPLLPSRSLRPNNFFFSELRLLFCLFRRIAALPTLPGLRHIIIKGLGAVASQTTASVSDARHETLCADNLAYGNHCLRLAS